MAEKLNKDAVYKAAKPQEKDYFINDGGVQNGVQNFPGSWVKER